MKSNPLTRERLLELLGPVADAPPSPDAEVHEEVECDGYVRRRVSYAVPAGRAAAFVCVPRNLKEPAPLVFCHHQHAGRFDLGKSEVGGLRGEHVEVQHLSGGHVFPPPQREIAYTFLEALRG